MFYFAVRGHRRNPNSSSYLGRFANQSLEQVGARVKAADDWSDGRGDGEIVSCWNVAITNSLPLTTTPAARNIMPL